jgi:hypothetical protein
MTSVAGRKRCGCSSLFSSRSEVLMSGRRSHTRFAVAKPWNGVIRVLRDAVVNRTEREELLAITLATAVAGEELSLDLLSGGQNVAIKVQVIESRPVIVDGALRHRLRLALPAALGEGTANDGTVEAAP